jgi:hypothetical protein
MFIELSDYLLRQFIGQLTDSSIQVASPDHVHSLGFASAVRGQLLGQTVAPQPGEAAGLLRRGQGAAPGVRVHVQGQPGKPSLQE